MKGMLSNTLRYAVRCGRNVRHAIDPAWTQHKINILLASERESQIQLCNSMGGHESVKLF